MAEPSLHEIYSIKHTKCKNDVSEHKTVQSFRTSRGLVAIPLDHTHFIAARTSLLGFLDLPLWVYSSSTQQLPHAELQILATVGPGAIQLKCLYDYPCVIFHSTCQEHREFTIMYIDCYTSWQQPYCFCIFIHVGIHIYTAVLLFYGQQGAAIEALTCLQCWASALGLPLVLLEPVLSENYLKAVSSHILKRSYWNLMDSVVAGSKKSVLQFSDIFDIEHFNKESTKMHYAPFVNRNFFFNTAPYRVVFVNIREVNNNQLPNLLVTTLLPDEDDTCGCIDPFQISLMDNETKYDTAWMVDKGFCIVKFVDIVHQLKDMPAVFTESQVRRDILGKESYDRITLVFNYWRANFVVENTNSASKCYAVGYHSFKHNVHPSLRLLNEVQYYENHFLNSSNKIAAMVRIEHIYTFLRGYPRAKPFKPGEWSMDKCLRKTEDTIHDLQENHGYGRPLLTLDIGRFGSVAWKTEMSDKEKEAHQYGHEFFSQIYGNSWSFSDWEKSFTQASGGVEDSGYIAALQRSVATRADCLILVGGGSFHEVTLMEYMAYHKDRSKWCIHLICSKNGIDLESAIGRYKHSS